MKFLHISDLHLGIKVYEYDMIEDQKYILDKIHKIAIREKADAILISGDIYDKLVPPVDAVVLFDDFLTKISTDGIKAYIISGNHDSKERLSFGKNIFEKNGIIFSGIYDGSLEKHVFKDEYGDVNIYLMPFLKPSYVKHFASDACIESYDDAIKYVLEKEDIDFSKRNIILAHQNVTGAKKCDSEEVVIGGIDNISSALFEKFDYAALGHIHTPQRIDGKEYIRYCGTPLKYSFSEISKEKTVPIVEILEKGNVKLSFEKLEPLRDMREIRGKYADLTLKSSYENTAIDDYIHVTLTDENDILDAINKLKTIYQNIMKLDYDNAKTRSVYKEEKTKVVEKTPFEIFEDFYMAQNGQKMTDDEKSYLENVMEEIFNASD